MAGAVAAAWFVPMALRHGIGPLVAGVGSRELDVPGVAVTILAEMVNPPNLAFTVGAVGLVVAVIRRRWDLLAWVAVTALGVAVVDRWLAIPFAILAGLAVDAALEHPRRLSSVAILAVAVITTVTGVALAPPNETMTAEDRAVMQWAAEETPPDATFAVIGYPAAGGFVDWFPALSGRENVTTWQGTEWIPDGFRREEATQGSTCRSPSCVPDANYYVIGPGCCPEVEGAIDDRTPGLVPTSGSEDGLTDHGARVRRPRAQPQASQPSLTP